jgi:hypothetical protein
MLLATGWSHPSGKRQVPRSKTDQLGTTFQCAEPVDSTG